MVMDYFVIYVILIFKSILNLPGIIPYGNLRPLLTDVFSFFLLDFSLRKVLE